jgi:thiol-disulfide isomerase/thioredoxin
VTEANVPKAKSDRSWLYLALAFTLLWGVYIAWLSPFSGRLAEPRLEPPGSQAVVDYSWKLLDLNDGLVEFSRFKGKTVFLNIWATWCGPCVMEMPTIERLAAKPGLKDVEFVCVSTDESAATVRRFLAGKNWPMTVLRATSLPPAFQTEGIPATFLISADGRLAASEVGAVKWDNPAAVAFLIDLAKPSGADAPPAMAP